MTEKVVVTETYERIGYNQLGYKAIYGPTTGSALDGQVLSIEFSMAGSPVKAPETLKVTVEYDMF